MNERADELQDALAQIDERWDAQRTERTLAGVHHKRGRRRTRRALLLSASVLIFAGASFASYRALGPAAQVTQATPGARGEGAAHKMQFNDGSEVTLLAADSQLVVDEVSDTRVTVRLASGRARFSIVHREQRAFVVRCGAVTVEVLGTAFELERDGERTRVAVSRGRVAVQSGTERSVLTTGEAGWFPKAQPAAAEPEADAQPEPAEREPNGVRPTARVNERPGNGAKNAPALDSWREQAEQGDFKRAYELLVRAPRKVADDVEELMLAADAARLSGHPGDAVSYLQRVVDRHPRDSRAPLAAFTLGGVLMHQLGQPREAEAAYARARALALSPQLAQDALARQVEAAHRAGDSAHARTLAKEYLTRFPDGRRVHAVRRFGGL